VASVAGGESFEAEFVSMAVFLSWQFLSRGETW
jgi:hypothetical protein